MAPLQYMTRYHQCYVMRANHSVLVVRVDRYLSRTGSDTARQERAWRAYHTLVGELAQATGSPRYHPAYEVRGRVISTETIRMPHIGKGSPGDIDKTIFALTFCHPDMTDAEVQRYCDSYFGLDCNGFASNYYGLNRNTDVSQFMPREKLLRSTSEIGFRSALVWRDPDRAASEHPCTHVAVVQRMGVVNGNNAQFTIVHSDSADGLHEETVSHDFQPDGSGFIHYVSTRRGEVRHVYAAAPTTETPPNY